MLASSVGFSAAGALDSPVSTWSSSFWLATFLAATFFLATFLAATFLGGHLLGFPSLLGPGLNFAQPFLPSSAQTFYPLFHPWINRKRATPSPAISDLEPRA